MFLWDSSVSVSFGWFGKHLNFSACIRNLVSLLLLKDRIAASFFISLIGVVLFAPVIMRRDWFWTLLSVRWFFL